MKKIILFASGSGSNAEKIMMHFEKNSLAKVVQIFTNNPEAKVLERAKKYDVPTQIVSKLALEQSEFLKKIQEINPDLIVLAGFLLKFPSTIIERFPMKVINIHPALLPKYGGKGMYGMHVHKTVLENKEAESGITIHYVNENYDEGEFIFQQSVGIQNCKTAEEIAEKVHELEHLYFPKIIETLISKNEK